MPSIVRAPARAARLPLAAIAALTGSACALPDAESDLTSESADVRLSQLAESPTSLQAPDGSYFASVQATGSGCPPGSTHTRISADGQVFTTTFSAYEATLSPTAQAAERDCQITVKLHSPAGTSYAVSSFHYLGYAYLSEGVIGLQTANYFFEETPVGSRSVRTELVGPRDDQYAFRDTVEVPEEYVWSPCGTDRDLTIRTRLLLQNGRPRGDGYMNLSALDGSSKLEFKLAWRECAVPALTPPSPPPPPPARPPAKPPSSGVDQVASGVGNTVGGLGNTLGGVLGGVVGGLGGILGGLLGGLGLGGSAGES